MIILLFTACLPPILDDTSVVPVVDGEFATLGTLGGEDSGPLPVDTGDTGETGSTGETGVTVDTGETGSTVDTGETGRDTGIVDTGSSHVDTGVLDTGVLDTGVLPVDTGTVDTGSLPVDTGTIDTGGTVVTGCAATFTDWPEPWEITIATRDDGADYYTYTRTGSGSVSGYECEKLDGGVTTVVTIAFSASSFSSSVDLTFHPATSTDRYTAYTSTCTITTGDGSTCEVEVGFSATVH